MTVKNYYSMDKKTVDEYIWQMRKWFWKYEGSPHWDRVTFAFHVARNATEIIPYLEKDPVLKQAVEVLCTLE